jgi:hypothetical protein
MPHTYPEIANWAGYSLGHRGRRLREAIELSKWIALRKLKAKLGGIKLDDVWPLLLEICHDLALYIGGSAVAGGLLGAAVGSMGLGIGAVPGALAGTAAGVQIGQMLLGFIGLKSVIEYMLDQLPVAIDEYRKGFLIAWGPMPSKHDIFSETPASRYNFESNAMAAGNFARGHEIIIIALLMGIVTYLGRGQGNLKALMAEASSHSKLGPKFATWLEQNARELSASPILQVRPKGGGRATQKNSSKGAASREPTSKAEKPSTLPDSGPGAQKTPKVTASESDTISPPEVPIFNPAGAARAEKFNKFQQKVSARETIARIAGDDPMITYTASAKTIYLNPATGKQVVYDNAGKYFRVEDTTVTGPLRYTDQFGHQIPNNVPLIKQLGTSQTGVPADVRKALTHFSDGDL